MVSMEIKEQDEYITILLCIYSVRELDQNNSLVFDKGNDGTPCAWRILWWKWKSLNLPLYCFLKPLPSFLVPLSLPPPVPRSLHLHVIHPSSPSAHPIIKSFSCCFAKCHVNPSSSASFFFTFSPPFSFTHFLYIFPMSRLEEMCRCQGGTAIYGQ